MMIAYGDEKCKEQLILKRSQLLDRGEYALDQRKKRSHQKEDMRVILGMSSGMGKKNTQKRVS